MIHHVAFKKYGAKILICCTIGVGLLFVVTTTTQSRHHNSRENALVQNRHSKSDHDSLPPKLPSRLSKQESNRRTDSSNIKNRKIASAKNSTNRCPPLYGRVDVFVAVVTESYKNFYQVAQSTLNCYLKTTNYRLRLVDLNTDRRVAAQCSHDQVNRSFLNKNIAFTEAIQVNRTGIFKTRKLHGKKKKRNYNFLPLLVY